MTARSDLAYARRELYEAEAFIRDLAVIYPQIVETQTLVNPLYLAMSRLSRYRVATVARAAQKIAADHASAFDAKAVQELLDPPRADDATGFDTPSEEETSR